MDTYTVVSAEQDLIKSDSWLNMTCERSPRFVCGDEPRTSVQVAVQDHRGEWTVIKCHGSQVESS